jgi:hypothetical protein
MRPVSGFERPLFQWLYVALGVVLVLVAAGEAVGLRRLRGEIAILRASDLNGRIERGRVQGREARERSAREALALEVARLRGSAPSGATYPTLTLSPLAKRGGIPPSPTVEAPGETQLLQLRLQLPGGSAATVGSYAIAVRTWSGGEAIWSRGGLHASSIEGRAMVTALMTGDVLSPGAYEIALTSASPEGKTSDVAAYEVAVGNRASH